jgi:hypothetical protein
MAFSDAHVEWIISSYVLYCVIRGAIGGVIGPIYTLPGPTIYTHPTSWNEWPLRGVRYGLPKEWSYGHPSPDHRSTHLHCPFVPFDQS